MTTTLKPGDRVRIKTEAELEKCLHINPHMFEFCEKEATIVSTRYFSTNGYTLDVDNGVWDWKPDHIDLITPPQDGAEPIPFAAMEIVNQLFDLAEVPVDLRQSINDRADQYVTERLTAYTAALRARVDAQNNELVSLRTTIADLWAAEIERDALRARVSMVTADDEHLRAEIERLRGEVEELKKRVTPLHL